MRNSLRQQYVARHASAGGAGCIAPCTASSDESKAREPGGLALRSIDRRCSIHLFPSPKPGSAASLALRKIRADDAAALQDFVRELSPASRRLRFHAALNELPAASLQALTRVDQRAHVAFVLTSKERGTERIVGEARYVVSGDGETAEFGIAVADAFRGLGSAERLLAAVVDAARSAGLRWLVGDVLAGNARMRAFVRRCGFAETTRGVEPGLVRVERRVDRALAASQAAGSWTGTVCRRVRRVLAALPSSLRGAARLRAVLTRVAEIARGDRTATL